MDRVRNKVAIVTGAARGIGAATAELLAGEGATVILTDIDAEVGGATTEDLRSRQLDVSFLPHDVSSEDDWARVVQEVRSHHGRLDVLVNNAGLYLIEDLEKTSLADLQRIFAVNVHGTFLGMRRCAPVMAEQGGGSIINLSSMDGIVGSEGHTAYGASKAAVRMMTKTAALEYGMRRVRINSIHPGYIRTRMAEYGARKYGESLEELGEEFPLGHHIGEPRDVASGVLYLASDESRWVTGSELVIDGGATAQ